LIAAGKAQKVLFSSIAQAPPSVMEKQVLDTRLRFPPGIPAGYATLHADSLIPDGIVR